MLLAQQGPDESAEFPGDGHLDLVAMEAPGQQTHKAVVESVLGFPAQGADRGRLILLSAGEFLADFGGQCVVLGTFDQ